MLEGVERLVNLSGLRATAADREGAALETAVRDGDVAALGGTSGEFAVVARNGHTVRLARTLGLPLRYFVAKMYHGPFLVVSDRVDRIFDWCVEQRIGWQFDPAYTRMVPAHHLVEVDQVGCPDPAPRYRRFFAPPAGAGPADVEASGETYIAAAAGALGRWLDTVPAGQPVAVAFSGGVDSTAVYLLARHLIEAAGGDPARLRAFTLDLGDGEDARQAGEVARALGFQDAWDVIEMPASDYDLGHAIAVIEDYHPLDVECAAASLCLLAGIRARYPRLRWLLDGDGGDENLKSYPLEDSDLTLSSVLKNPLLYQEGWGVDAIKHSLVYSGGLSRSYVRTYAPAREHGFAAYSPFAAREAVAAAQAMPFDALLGGDPDRLATLKQDVVAAGVRAITGVDMPVRPKRRFQDGAGGRRAARPTKAWCRRVFNEQWAERLRPVMEEATPRSGNEMSLGALAPLRG